MSQGTADPSVSGAPAASAPPRPPWIRLSAGPAVLPAEEPLRTRFIVAQVMAAAAIVVLAVAVVGAVASRRVAERESVSAAAHTADMFADAVVQPALTEGLLKGEKAALEKIDAAVRSVVLSDSIVRVKIWSREGRIVYSDEKRLIGLTFPLGEDEREVLVNPTLRAEVSDLEGEENQYEQGQGKLLEVYRPVWTPEGQPLLFETYSPYSIVTSRAGGLWRGFAGITLSSLLFLVVLLLPVVWRLLERLKRGQQQREALLQRAVDASDQERRRIAGTLHDGVVQELAATSFAVAGAAERAAAAGQPELAHRLHASAGAVRASIRGLRSLLVDIYPPSLSSAGIIAALGDLSEVLRARDVTVRLDLSPGAAAALDEQSERLIFRVAQECLRNAARHSSASLVQVRLQREGTMTALEIEDNGSGFDAEAVIASPEQGHFGVRVLGDLAADVGAVLLLSTAPGAGCRWRLEVPDR